MATHLQSSFVQIYRGEITHLLQETWIIICHPPSQKISINYKSALHVLCYVGFRHAAGQERGRELGARGWAGNLQ